MSNFRRNILITGGAGFIGSHVVRHFVKKYPQLHIYNIDKLTYAGNLENLKEIEDYPNYTFIKSDINNAKELEAYFRLNRFGHVIHLAAESHVDRSLCSPMDFVMTNIVGTVNLLNAVKKYWLSWDHKGRFYHISTDEVYGSLGQEGAFTEETPYNPNSPYSASKASSDMLVRSYGRSWKLPFVISNCSNNYGPGQFPEKLIPLAIRNICLEKQVPIYGKGENIRDWLFIEDHVKAIDLIFHHGQNGQTYNVGGENEWRNIDLIRFLCHMMDRKLGKAPGSSEKLITFVKDRLGHDERYAIDCTKLKNELNWKPLTSFERGLEMTVDWYLNHEEWVHGVTTGEYQHYYERQYA